MRTLIDRVAVKLSDDLRKSKPNALQTYSIDKTVFTGWQNILGSRTSPVVTDVGRKVVELRYLDVTGEKVSQKSKWRGAQQDMLVTVSQALRKSGYRWESRRHEVEGRLQPNDRYSQREAKSFWSQCFE